MCGIRHQASHRVDDGPHENRGNDSQGNNVEQHLGGEVGGGSIVAVGSFACEEKTLAGEYVQTRQSAKAKERQKEEEQSESVLESRNIIGQAVEQVSREDCKDNGNRVVSEHEHWVSVQVLPCSSRDDDELAQISNSSVSLSNSAGINVWPVGSISVRVGSVRSIGFPNCLLNVFSNGGRDVRLAEGACNDVKVCSSHGRRR